LKPLFFNKASFSESYKICVTW